MTPEQFEERVRRMARSMWQDPTIGRDVGDPIRPQGGPAEIDTIIQTRFEVIVVDATMSQEARVVRDKIASLKAHRKNMQGKSGKPIRAFIITSSEPTQHQIKEVKDAKSDWISIYSYSQFQSLMVDATGYLAKRSLAKFGSVRSLERGGQGDFPLEHFVQPTFSDLRSKIKVSFDQLTRLFVDLRGPPPLILIAGIFGMGKSMTTRALFHNLREKFEKSKTDRFPLHLNLDEHQGQVDPDEAIRRHADKIGMRAIADGLIQAWRAGMVTIILDGFDELVATPWSSDIRKRRTVRRMSMSLVKRFIQESPTGTPIVLSGRWTYFDDTQEMYDALGISPDARGFRHLDMEDFSPDQMQEFLRNIRRPDFGIPYWLPLRPLLVGYLATTTDQTNKLAAQLSPAEGWAHLIDMVAEREERQDFRLERNSVREILERLATHGRETEDGHGAFSDELILRTFTAVTGANPDYASVNVVLRLPFLRPMPDSRGFRSFLDSDSADALRAGDVGRFIRDHSRDNVFSVIKPELSNNMASAQLTIDTIVMLSRTYGFTRKQLLVAAESANGFGYSGIAGELAIAAGDLEGVGLVGKISIGDARFQSIDFTEIRCSDITFVNCIFDEICLDIFESSALPVFNNCLFGSVAGMAALSEMASNFVECAADRYDTSYATNADTAEGALPPQIRTMQTVLRKLFFQRGGARQENAFYRGRLPQAMRDSVAPVIDILIAHGFCRWDAARSQRVLVPDRGRAAEASELLYRPMSSKLPMMEKIKSLKM